VVIVVPTTMTVIFMLFIITKTTRMVVPVLLIVLLRLYLLVGSVLVPSPDLFLSVRPLLLRYVLVKRTRLTLPKFVW
jgi:hypothetical protein